MVLWSGFSPTGAPHSLATTCTIRAVVRHRLPWLRSSTRFAFGRVEATQLPFHYWIDNALRTISVDRGVRLGCLRMLTFERLALGKLPISESLISREHLSGHSAG